MIADLVGPKRSNNPIISNFSSILGGENNRLKTEVKILESPLILKPTFDFVKANKLSKGEKVDNWTFQDWRDSSLSIDLEKGTSVLNIAYQDTNRDLVLPVMRKISSDYQHYSDRDRTKAISSGLAFATEQVEKFRKKSAKSSRALDAFAIRYGIANSGEAISGSESDFLRFLGANSTNSSFNIFRQANSTNSIRRQGDTLSQLAGINQELIRRQQLFTDRDPGVLALMRERDALRQFIEVTAGGSLTLPGQQPTSKEQAQELILKFKELSRKAKRDIATLDLLEKSLMSLQLEQARQRDLWELISTPTLLDKPVAPRKTLGVVLGLIGGLMIGSGAALVRERCSDLVFDEEELKCLLPCPLIKHLPAKDGSILTDTADLLASGPLAKTPRNTGIALIPIGNIPSEQLRAFGVELGRALEGRELLISTDLRQTSRCGTQLLVTSRGAATRTQLSELRQKLALQGSPLAGWILLDPKLNLG